MELGGEGRGVFPGRCRDVEDVAGVKLPVSTVRAIRAYARHSGLSLGQVVAQAVTAVGQARASAGVPRGAG